MPRRFRPKDFAFDTRRGLSHRNGCIRERFPGVVLRQYDFSEAGLRARHRFGATRRVMRELELCIRSSKPRRSGSASDTPVPAR